MARKQKPEKPYEGFPLFAHACGQWAKKIRGKMHYFGVWANPDAALNEYLDQRDDLQAGRTPPAYREGITVKDLANGFLASKKKLLDSGELSPRTWHDYHTTCAGVAEFFGRGRLVHDLRSSDFADLRAELAKKRGPVALGNEIQRIRSLFKFAVDERHIAEPVHFGSQFRRPARKVLRRLKHERDPKTFTAAELRTILDSAPMPLRAMVLLGINAGLGQTDLACMTRKTLERKPGWLVYPRPKTGAPRLCPLWPETREAIEVAIRDRPEPVHSADAELVFLTYFGRRWVRENKSGSPNDEIGKAFGALLKELGLARPGRRFYGLRHTLETIGGEAKDQTALDWIMGHTDDSMADHYRHDVSDKRLRAVTETVRKWLSLAR